ncbi:hypothetical protein SMSP2_00897 [Limihaloglobus sulfuriphilus]|uniref:Uncharacterized protein n=1 Tax=Limihaloglobus sulfuriphilus TaxID=1851148 RepID=A0A1Q2MCX7_9BACT|nr:hypothetical protein [Limihaloglobus sulfuriphilus]AQQ70545.1 hypothetical protein SMSP2_00897 [Limihaloglobus sulfuriphilus]
MKNHLCISVIVCICLFGSFQTQAKLPPEIFTAEEEVLLTDYLRDIADWIMSLDLGSGQLKNTEDTDQSIFINGNFARVLVSAYRLTGEEKYKNEAVKWADGFCNQQQLTITSQINQGGFWADFPRREIVLYSNIYFGDMGTAATALSVIYKHADSKRQPIYLDCLKRMALFVTEGSIRDPQFLGRDTTGSFIIKSGEHKGALGCGYYRGHLSMEPYTISTATTAGAFMSQMYELTNEPKYRNISTDAVNWLLKVREADGEIPYMLDGKELDTWPLDTLTYCSEAFLGVYRFMNDIERAEFAKDIRPTIDWILRNQNDDGTWGQLRSPDQQRSPGVVSLLNWYYVHIQQDADVKEAVKRFFAYMLVPENSEAYGIKELVRTTGFLGLTVSEILKPDSTF